MLNIFMLGIRYAYDTSPRIIDSLEKYILNRFTKESSLKYFRHPVLGK